MYPQTENTATHGSHQRKHTNGSAHRVGGVSLSLYASKPFRAILTISKAASMLPVPTYLNSLKIGGLGQNHLCSLRPVNALKIDLF